MVVKRLLTDEKRREILEWIALEDKPNQTPQAIRSLRTFIKDVDFKEMVTDVGILKKLRDVELATGRPAARAVSAVMFVNHPDKPKE